MTSSNLHVICLPFQIKLTAQEEVALELGASQVCSSSFIIITVDVVVIIIPQERKSESLF